MGFILLGYIGIRGVVRRAIREGSQTDETSTITMLILSIALRTVITLGNTVKFRDSNAINEAWESVKKVAFPPTPTRNRTGVLSRINDYPSTRIHICSPGSGSSLTRLMIYI